MSNSSRAPSGKPRRETTADRLRELIAARAAKLGWTPYRIARECGGSPNQDTVRRYLDGRTSLNSAYVSAIATALGWDGRVSWDEFE